MFFKVCKYTGVFKKRMLEVINKQRDADNLTLYRIVLLRVRSSNFQNTVSNSIRMHYLFFLLLKFSQNAQYIVLDFKMFSAGPTSEKILSLLSAFTHHFQIPKTSFKMRKNVPFCVLCFKICSISSSTHVVVVAAAAAAVVAAASAAIEVEVAASSAVEVVAASEITVEVVAAVAASEIAVEVAAAASVEVAVVVVVG